jgi:hypothetical protein
MKLGCTNGATLRFAQLWNQLMMPSGRSADAVGK